MTNLFLFHRDLRLFDNTTLIEQIKQEKKVIPIFIFTPEQINPNENKYFSNHSVQYMIESLKELSQEISKKGGEFYFLYGDTLEVLKKIHRMEKINSIGFNMDYTPYARKRDDSIEKWCKDEKITFYKKEDFPLYDFINGETLKKDKKPYLVYTPFMKFVSSKLKVRPINTFSSFLFEKSPKIKKISLHENKVDTFYKKNPNLNTKGGRSHSLEILKNIKNFKKYNQCRNYLFYKTTKLSSSLKYNTVSIREVYWTILKQLGKKSGLIREFIFRDFYMNIIYYFPQTLEGQIQKGKNKSFRKEYDSISWKKNSSLFKKWQEGKTGFPVVDAGMRQMNKIGYMHNRCRMIVSNFLVKDLHLDWRLGEQYFAQTLEDYDPINNSSGWQWSTGNGTDAQPYFRIFNPWTQQEDYDPYCKYIKEWIPELESVPPKEIHQWYKEEIRKKYSSISYPPPIINHDTERKKTLEMYKEGLKKS